MKAYFTMFTLISYLQYLYFEDTKNQISCAYCEDLLTWLSIYDIVSAVFVFFKIPRAIISCRFFFCQNDSNVVIYWTHICNIDKHDKINCKQT